MKREYLLGLPVDVGSLEDVLEWVGGEVKRKNGARHVITAYSEFFVRAGKDTNFAAAWKEADLITVDGMGVLGMLEYKKVGLVKALLKMLAGRLGRSVTGVELFKRLVAKGDYKIFLLGGFGDTVDRLARKLGKKNLAFDRGAQNEGEMTGTKNDMVVDRINRFAPDILFVAYGPGRQEKWIYKNKSRLKAKVAIGVGGTFDEVLGKFLQAPKWMEERGLKWLQRLIVDPKRWKRIINAVIVFPLMVFTDTKIS